MTVVASRTRSECIDFALLVKISVPQGKIGVWLSGSEKDILQKFAK